MSTTKPSYTLPERRAINKGWDTLIAFAESHGAMDDDHRLSAALAEERRQTQDLVAAKGLLLGALIHAGDVDTTVLWSMRAAHRDIIAYSWQMHDTHRSEVSDPKRTTWCDVLQAAADAAELYRQAKDRFFNSLTWHTARH